MNERIRKVREHCALSRAAFGEKLGVSGDVVNNLERGRVEAKEPIVKLICSVYSVDEHWLRTGEGDMFVKQSNEDELASTVERLLTGETSEFKKRLVRVLAGLDEKHWVLLEEKLKEIVGVQQAQPVSSEADIYTEADAVAAATRSQCIMEKKAEDISSASPSDTGSDAGKMA